MSNEENKDFNEAAEELKNINVNDAEELEILEDTGDEISEEELQAKYEEILARAKENGFKNRPYEKIMNEEGDVANPVLKGNPYLNPFPNRSQRRRMLKANKQPKNNSNGARLVIKRVGNDFLRYHIVDQHIPANVTPVYEELSEEQIEAGNKPAITGSKFHKARVVQHYVLATKITE